MQRELGLDAQLVQHFAGGPLGFGGRQFGARVQVDLRVTGTDDDKSPADAGSKYTLDLTFDGCIDGTSSSGTIKNEVVMKFGGIQEDRRRNKKYHVSQELLTDSQVKREEVRK